MHIHYRSVLRSLFSVVASMGLIAGIAIGQNAPSSVQQALDLSKATGRPIFVMAGRET